MSDRDRSVGLKGAASNVALDQLSAKNVVELCSEHETQPIVNAGTLYA